MKKLLIADGLKVFLISLKFTWSNKTFDGMYINLNVGILDVILIISNNIYGLIYCV